MSTTQRTLTLQMHLQTQLRALLTSTTLVLIPSALVQQVRIHLLQLITRLVPKLNGKSLASTSNPTCAKSSTSALALVYKVFQWMKQSQSTALISLLMVSLMGKKLMAS